VAKPIDAALAEPTDASVPDAGAADAAVVKKRKKKAAEIGPKESLKVDERMRIPMPYGAPPARRRLV
jgi:hypothetical protein